jgi:hypothetical protein
MVNQIKKVYLNILIESIKNQRSINDSHIIYNHFLINVLFCLDFYLERKELKSWLNNNVALFFINS